jgi:hypothetical protein
MTDKALKRITRDDTEHDRYYYLADEVDALLAQPEQEYDWKDLYEKEKRRSAMWLAKYEEVAGPAPKAYPVAQPEQEPLAWMSADRFDELRQGFTVMTTLTKKKAFEDDVAIYTTPPQRKPLDHNKKIEIAELASMKFEWSSDYIQAISFVVEQCEAAHNIKE